MDNYGKTLFKSLSPYVISILLMPRKNSSWRMCMNSHAINRTTVKYKIFIPKLDDLLDMMARSRIFLKIDLRTDTIRSGYKGNE